MKTDELIAKIETCVTPSGIWKQELSEPDKISLLIACRDALKGHESVPPQKDAPLAATVVDGLLLMSIGVSTLAHAAANREADPLTVTDEEGFAKDVLEHLGDDNFGSNPLEELLDTAMELAADLGSPHIEDPDETLKRRAGLN